MTASGAAAQPEPSIRIPDPDAGEMEPQVREKIARQRDLVAADSGSPAAWGALGRTFQAHGLEPEAEEAYGRAEELDPADFRWPYLRGIALRNIRPEDALSAAGRSAELNPGYTPVHLLAGELLESAGSAERAMDRYRRALETAPDSALAELGIGRLLLRRGELEAARERLERAAALAPRAGPVQAELARLYTRLGETEAARRAAQAARDLPDLVPVDDPLLSQVWEEAVSTRGTQQRALRAEAAGDFEAAEALYDHLVSLQPGDPDILYNFGNLYVRTRRFGEAAERYREALAARPDHVAARVNLGSALLMLGRRDEAMDHLLRALEHDPADPDANRTLGGLFAYRGENVAAIRHYRAVLARDPQDGPVHRDLAIVLAAEGEFAAAWEHVGAAERLGSPPDTDFLLRLQAALPRPR
ncbi:MAG: tetratricopeptide repeat protein [Acidobacteriota bacterium]|nr:tetratricopeptide repeat protein [Acidobacteriota bacterium]